MSDQKLYIILSKLAEGIVKEYKCLSASYISKDQYIDLLNKQKINFLKLQENNK